jgi:hypothetical protein
MLLRPRLLADRGYGISSGSNQIGELLIGNLQAFSHNPDLDAIVEVELVTSAHSLASGHSGSKILGEFDQVQAGVTPPES